MAQISITNTTESRDESAHTDVSIAATLPANNGNFDEYDNDASSETFTTKKAMAIIVNGDSSQGVLGRNGPLTLQSIDPLEQKGY